MPTPPRSSGSFQHQLQRAAVAAEQPRAASGYGYGIVGVQTYGPDGNAADMPFHLIVAC